MTRTKTGQLDFEDRCIIARMLSERQSFSTIASTIGVARSTISREVVRNRTRDGIKITVYKRINNCAYQKDCLIRHLCSDKHCNRLCRMCRDCSCMRHCSHYREMCCDQTTGSPYVCNGCKCRQRCTLCRYTYRAKEAQLATESRASSARCGIDASQKDIETMVKTVKMLSKQGQSIEHIWNTHSDEFPVSRRTFYRHLAERRYDMTDLELVRKCRYRPRKKAVIRADQIDFSARRYRDWEALGQEARTSTVQIDCIEGLRADTKAILTLHLVRYHFQIPILLAKHTSEYVIKALDWLEQISDGHFKEIFGILLADRGAEFLNHQKIEHSRDRKKRCSVYYCDPARADQKGACEKNHVEIRRIVPKKTSFEKLTAADMADIASHVNSYTRKSLGGKAPIDLATCVLPEGFLDELGIRRITPDEVNLTPDLLKRSER